MRTNRRLRQPRKIIHTEPKDISSIDEYDELFPFTNSRNSITVREKALEKAWHVRDFEIEMYWKRATYFWAFIASTFALYFAVISSDNYNKVGYFQLHVFEFLIICLGLLLSLSWYLVNRGSKKWQSNWEGHIDRLEDNFTGPLYKVVSSNKSHSVSRVNQIVSEIVLSIWGFLFCKYLIVIITSILANGLIAMQNFLGVQTEPIIHFLYKTIKILKPYSYMFVGSIGTIVFIIRLLINSKTGREDKDINFKIRRSK